MRGKIFKVLSFLCLLCISLLFSFDESKGVHFESGSWSQAIKEAQTSHRPIFLFIGTKQCRLSCRMEAEMQNNEEVAEFYNSHFICYHMDPAEVSTNFRLTNWGITEVPVVLFMNSNKKIIQRLDGYQDPKNLITEGYRAVIAMEKQKNGKLYFSKN